MLACFLRRPKNFPWSGSCEPRPNPCWQRSTIFTTPLKVSTNPNRPNIASIWDGIRLPRLSTWSISPCSSITGDSYVVSIVFSCIPGLMISSNELIPADGPETGSPIPQVRGDEKRGSRSCGNRPKRALRFWRPRAESSFSPPKRFPSKRAVQRRK